MAKRAKSQPAPAGVVAEGGSEDAAAASSPPAAPDAAQAAIALAQEVTQAASGSDPSGSQSPDTGPPAGHMQAEEGYEAGTPVEAPPASVPAPMGRPTLYSDEMAATICSRLSSGESLRSICRSEGMPHVSTVMGWVFRNSEFFIQYRAAREMQAEVLADELLEIADDGSNDWMERHGNSPGYRINGEALQRSSLRINTRQWIASRLLPKRWGDKQQVTHQNPDGTPVAQTVSIDPRTMSPEAREALADALRAAMQEGAIETDYEERS